MRTSTFTIKAGATEEYSVSGNYLLLRQSAVDLIIENPLTNEKFEASQGDDFQIKAFKSLLITNPSGADQLIKLTVATDKKAGSAKVGGSVSIAGSISLVNGAVTQTQATVTNANNAILAANANRKILLIQNNDAAAVMRVTLDGSAATATKGFRIEAGGSMDLSIFAPTGVINAFMETAGSGANNVEIAAA